MPFIYQRTIRFQDTDAAGVVYFANVLHMCHEAYEDSLAAFGINLKLFFSNSFVAIPIVHASVDFFRPMFVGDKISIHLLPQQSGGDNFEIVYQVFRKDDLVAKAMTKHVCIQVVEKKRTDLFGEIIHWLRET